METAWVLGDQLNRRLGPLRVATPATSRILMVESRAFGARAADVLAALDAGTL